jgi:hypothetical protein
MLLNEEGAVGEHLLTAKAYVPSQHFERCQVGKELTVIFRVSGEPVAGPRGKVGWYRIFRYNDFFPNLGSVPPEMYRKTGPRGFGHIINGQAPFVEHKETRKKTDVGTLLREASCRYRIPLALLTAVIEVESAFDAGAVSQKGAMGLMQLMPATCARFGVRRPFDPAENVEGGAKYLNYLLHQWSLGYPASQRMALSLAAYHAGEQTVEHYGGIPPFRETRDYVHRVLERYKSLEET